VPRFVARIAQLRPGTNARMKVVRDGKVLDLDVVVAKRTRPTPP
jgi:S1-C subfamily serine protease